MKQTILSKLEEFRVLLKTLKSDLTALKGDRVSKNSIRVLADKIATMWVEELRSPLEHKFQLPKDLITMTAGDMKHLYVVSRPNNLKSSYLTITNRVLKDFDDKFILPIKQTATSVDKVIDLSKILTSLPSTTTSYYLKEAIECAAAGHKRAAIVMGWCCAIDRIQQKIMALGFSQFNVASTALKNQLKGKFKNWNKEFQISTLSELQQIFDNDLIIVLEGMNIIDGNQSERLKTCFQYRCHSAHPGNAPIDDDHVVVFFKDIANIILSNPSFTV